MDQAAPKNIRFRRSILAQSKQTSGMVSQRSVNSGPRLTGEPVMRILCETSGGVVGYLYRWNNGDLQPAWLNGARSDVRYAPMRDAA